MVVWHLPCQSRSLPGFSCKKAPVLARVPGPCLFMSPPRRSCSPQVPINPMAQYKSDFLHVLEERGFIHQCTDLEALDAAGRRRHGHRLHRLRRHGALAARRQPDPDHDAALAAADRPPADRADGRRHHQGRRPLRQGHAAAAAHRRGDPRQHRLHPAACSRSSCASATAPTTRSWSTTTSGCRSSATSSSCATTACTSPSTAC